MDGFERSVWICNTMRPPIVSLSLLCGNRTQDKWGNTQLISGEREKYN